MSKFNITIEIDQKKIRIQTDSSGNFQTDSNPFKKPIYITVDGYQTKKLNNYSTKLDILNLGEIVMTPNPIALNEVVIKAKRRFSDTVAIDFSGDKFDRYTTIDDIFSTKGFSKDANGQLYYKGKIITNLSVDGHDFFGKNNKDIYTLIPAMVLQDIDVIETNIDSLTNTTNLRPTVKINLKLKEKYKKGMFGNANTGLGTHERYLIGTNLYEYFNKRQTSVTLNSNNINIRDVPTKEPDITFAANGNNVKSNVFGITYSNTLCKKLDVDLVLKLKSDVRNFLTESERQDLSVSQYSKATNKSNAILKGIPEFKLTLAYNIDSLNSLQLIQTDNYIKTTQNDSINYIVQGTNSSYTSNLVRKQTIATNNFNIDILYKKLFEKKGRSLNIKFSHTVDYIKSNEFDNVYNISNATAQSYFINNSRATGVNSSTLISDFTEPLNENSYLTFQSTYSNGTTNYEASLVSDSLASFLNAPTKFQNEFFKSGTQFHKSFRKVSFDSGASFLYNKRDSKNVDIENLASFINIDADLKIDYRINDKKDVSFFYNTTTNYPDKSQLININTSYDLISQMGNNLNLRPEVKNSLKFLFNSRKEQSGGFNINGGIDYYISKIATNINFEPGKTQYVYYDNVSNVLAATLGFGLYKNASKSFNFNYNNSINYQQQPIIVNNKTNPNSGVTFNQVASLTRQFFNNLVNISPVITTTFTKLYFETSSINVLTLSYSDKISFSVAKFELNVLPLITYSRSVNNLTSFSMNASLTRKLFGNGTLWLQGYDLFNSFKFNNNIISSAYTQTIRYSNISRYFILGINIKFDNF